MNTRAQNSFSSMKRTVKMLDLWCETQERNSLQLLVLVVSLQACFKNFQLGHTYTYDLLSQSPGHLFPEAGQIEGKCVGHWSNGSAIAEAGRAASWLDLLKTKSNCRHLEARELCS